MFFYGIIVARITVVFGIVENIDFRFLRALLVNGSGID